MNDVGLYYQILLNKLCRISVVGVYATHFGSGKEYVVRFFLGKEIAYCSLIGQIQLFVSSEDQGLRIEACGKQAADEGRADKATVAGNVNFRGKVQGW